jgi:hypothetical protein
MFTKSIKQSLRVGIALVLLVVSNQIRFIVATVNTSLSVSGVNVIQTPVELITSTAAPGNRWGGHQCRIVRTSKGIFTSYIVPIIGDDFNKQYIVVRRNNDNNNNGSWYQIGTGNAGPEPINLLGMPDGTLVVISSPNGTLTITTGTTVGVGVSNVWTWTAPKKIPGLPQWNWPYSAAGIDDRTGTVCVLLTKGGWSQYGEFFWSCRTNPTKEVWTTKQTSTQYRHAYSYIFPKRTTQLSIVAARDTTWSSLGYPTPPDTFDYAFNALGFWKTISIKKKQLSVLYTAEEKPTSKYPAPELNSQMDAYEDTSGRMHILYYHYGKTTKGQLQYRHLVLSSTGSRIADVALDGNDGHYQRIFQDHKNRYYIIGANGYIRRLQTNGYTPLGKPEKLNFDPYVPGYSGLTISVPRTGTPIGNIMEVVFPTEDDGGWCYFRLIFS